MNTTQAGLTVECKIHFQNARFGRKRMAMGAAPEAAGVPLGRVPRIARLMALALRFEDLLRKGEVEDYADLARLGHVTRARVTQIINFLNLAPSIQEEFLYLPPTEAGHDPIKEWQVRPIMAALDWKKQRRMWRELKATATTRGIST
jgi:hypothetical protein